jgi:glycerol-3-phosphate dehydrogenase
MAYTLADVVQRRTELGSAGLPQPATLQNCATLMGKVLGWDEAKTAQELKATTETFWPVGHTQPNMEAK